MSSESCQLADVAEVIDSLHKTPSYVVAGYPMVRVTDVKYGQLDLTKTFRVNQETYLEFSRKYKPSSGDIIVTRVGSYGIFGKVFDKEFCLGQNTAAIVPKDISSDYLYAVLNSACVQSQIEALVVGSTQKTLSLKAIKELKIPRLGSQTEQMISELAACLDDRIQLLSETNATLESIAQALFKSWFVDFDPVRAKMEGRAPEGMDEATAALFPDSFEESELGLVPVGWSITSLGEICDLQKGCSYKGEGLSDDLGAFMFNLGCFNAPRVFATEKIKRYVGDYRDRHSVEAGDLIIANTDMTQDRAILGRPLIVPEGYSPGFVSHHVFKVLPGGINQSVLKTFLFYSFLQQSFRERAVGYATGTTVLALPRDALLKHRLVLPEYESMSRFGVIAESTFTSIANNLQSIQTLANLRDTLLPRLISGQIRLLTD